MNHFVPEIWKPVPSKPGVMASDLGRVVLPPSYVPMHHGGFRLCEPVPTAGVERRAAKGASHVYLGIYSKKFGNMKVHRMVCEAFHGPPPFTGAVVIHLDENALNNRPENLKWGTQKENLNSPKFLEYCRNRVGENSPRTKWAAKRRAG